MERMKQCNVNSSSIQNTLYSLFDEDELNITKILLQLPDIIAESESRHRFSFNWGAKRRRSAINLSPSPPPLRSIPPSPTPTPPIIGTFGGEDCERLLIRKTETTSPATPLSFSPSESEEKSIRFSRKISKKWRKREEWLEMIAELTQRKELLQGEVETVRLHFNQLKALNLELQAKKAELICGEKVVPCMEINKSLNLKLEIAKPKPIVNSAMESEDMENQEEAASSTLVYNQPLIINQTVRKTETFVEVQHHPCSTQLTQLWSSGNGDVGMVKINNRSPLGIIPDLNVSIMDGSGMESLQQFGFRGALVNNRAQFNKAMAAEARKKRRQIYKVKNSIAANKPRYGHR